MKFESIDYKRINMDEFKEEVYILLDNFKQSDSLLEQVKIIDQINQLRNDLLTNFTIAQKLKSLVKQQSE
ncbi:hypothetical protein V1503_20550 [Bacillus sp. SCS-151]|uniref:hypothetical protein n=1 Tax=Nanhaiella sioensis TaxID=3115293 RepID=UPI00397B0E33